MPLSSLFANDRMSFRPEGFRIFTRSGLLRAGSILGTTETIKATESEGLPILGPWMNRLVARSCLRASLLIAVERTDGSQGQTRLNGVRIHDGATQGAKLRLLLATAGCLVGTASYSGWRGRHAFEYPWLMGVATLGRMVLVSANDLLSLYLGLEWSSLCLYVLASIRRGSAYSTEAGLKYFIMCAVASGFYLFGASVIYGMTGTIHFGDLERRWRGGSEGMRMEGWSPWISASVALGRGMVRMAFFFKLAVAPFHAWSPDVYEGSPMPSTVYFAVVPKWAMTRVILRLCMGPFAAFFETIQPMRLMGSMRSRGVAALSARSQRRLKRFRAYSAIGHMGYLLLGLSAGTMEGIQAARLYGMVYMVMSLNGWLSVMSLVKRTSTDDRRVSAKYITDRAGLYRRNPFLAATLARSVLSMAGIPPRGGFMAKLWVFLAAMSQSLVAYAVRAILASCVGAYYYLRWLKIMYFDGTTDGLTMSLGHASGSSRGRDRMDGERRAVDGWTSRVRGVTLGVRRLLMRTPGPLRLLSHRMALSLVMLG